MCHGRVSTTAIRVTREPRDIDPIILHPELQPSHLGSVRVPEPIQMIYAFLPPFGIFFRRSLDIYPVVMCRLDLLRTGICALQNNTRT